ncbi:GbsR/MarR family transcriptional regulator [Nannocystis punicea]|uniref:HTH-type transcriptional regulator n=1 Tax=Nannocystis punicea TaxID=2995304 RepID=A0ABY7GX61_9BACT|nr:hypothetical protein [Nannocystis poenicansa]WAS91459.1 hypothetical protein O0S08_35195 [Nannocystis poenicansa]
MPTSGASTLQTARERFIAQWGALGSAWGINRTMAQIHALLLLSPEPRSTDEVMEALAISRGNANTNLRELVTCGLCRKVVRPGERREYFEAEKDVWQLFCTILRERKRREIDPTRTVLRDCADSTRGLRDAEGRAVHEQLKALADFVELAASLAERVAATEQSKIVPAMLRLLG